MKQPPPTISNAEMDVLKVLWEHGPATVREVNEHLRKQRQWAYTTVLTLLGRLEDKGYVTCDRGEVAHVFGPAVSRDQLLRGRLRELADELCSGLASPLVQALVQGQQFSADEIEEFRRLLDEIEEEAKGEGKRTRRGKDKGKRRRR